MTNELIDSNESLVKVGDQVEVRLPYITDTSLSAADL